MQVSELDVDNFKMPAQHKTAVNRLLRHLKKAKIQTYHYEEAQKRKTRNVGRSQQDVGQQANGLGQSQAQQMSMPGQMMGKVGLSTARRKNRGTAVMSDSDGTFRAYGNAASKSKGGVSFRQQLSRGDRDAAKRSLAGDEPPAVGHYHPQFGLVSKRPRTHQFSCIGKFDTSGQQKPLQDPVRVPRAFEEQLQRVRMQRIQQEQEQRLQQQDGGAEGESPDKPDEYA